MTGQIKLLLYGLLVLQLIGGQAQPLLHPTSPDVAFQPMDTLLEVGNYKLHFTIWKGKGVPILFEAGGGDDASVWTKLVRPLAQITGATLLTYDRAGFGKSTLDTSKHGIANGIRGLEIGLQKLGYTGNVMLVAHSVKCKNSLLTGKPSLAQSQKMLL